ncbi:MAG: PLP-dependent aminotransferase family protein, partial [Kiloniellaceae bacterium]
PAGAELLPADGGAPADPLALLSPRGRALMGLRRTGSGPLRAFLPGAPETAEFPFDVWTRLHNRLWRHPAAALARLGAPAGLQVLREAIARYLATFRGLTCDWRQVIITAGAQQSLDLMIQLLLQPGDETWVEDPGYPGLRGPLIAAGARPVPVPLDGEGIMVAEGQRRAPAARAAIVTPTHHYPLGTPMTLARRLELLEWARDSGSWILEDDYDSEYRYAGRPLASLLSLATQRQEGARQGGATAEPARVIYIGSFSKVLFPSIRLGYLVVPESLVDAVSDAQNALGAQPTAVIQPVLAAFIDEGHFATHVRRMRRLYAARQTALLAAAQRHLGDFLEVPPDDAGLHLVAWLKPTLAESLGDRGAAAVAEAAGISLTPLCDYYAAPPAKGETRRPGLLMGYAAISEKEIERGARRLAEAFAEAI